MGVVSKNTSETKFITGGKEVRAEVVLDDGRTGSGRSGGVIFQGNQVEAISRAIKDATSKQK